MIKTKQDLKEYIAADLAVQPKPKSFMQRIRKKQIKLKYLLRKSEYHFNNSGKNIYHKLMYKYYWIRCKRVQDFYGSEICMNVFGKGLIIWHAQRIITNENARVGDYCSISTGVIIGQSGTKSPIIGNHVEIMVDAKILGGVTIVDDVRIGANALVIKDIDEPDTTWAGIPAKKISDRGAIEYPVERLAAKS